MNPLVYRVVLPACLAIFYIGVGAHRARLRRRLDHDPLQTRPGTGREDVAGFIDGVLPVTGTLMVVDTLLNALFPERMGEMLAVPLLRRSLVAGFGGLALVVLGLSLTAVAIAAMGESWRVGIDRRQPGPLVTTSVFARVRHPIYTGQLLLAAGVGLLTADVLSLPAASAAAVALMTQARIEEQFLGARHPEYADYMRRSGRFWPARG